MQDFYLKVYFKVKYIDKNSGVPPNTDDTANQLKFKTRRTYVDKLRKNFQTAINKVKTSFTLVQIQRS